MCFPRRGKTLKGAGNVLPIERDCAKLEERSIRFYRTSNSGKLGGGGDKGVRKITLKKKFGGVSRTGAMGPQVNKGTKSYTTGHTNSE